MDEDDEKWYEDQFDMFSSPGYRSLILKATEIAANLDTLRNTTIDTIAHKKGQLDILDWLISWQESVESTHKELLSEDAV